MATGGQTENGCNLINVEGVTLQSSNKYPLYHGIVVVSNKIFVIDWIDRKVRIHGLQDGRLLYKSDRLETQPEAVCLINDSEIAVILRNGLIKIISTHTTPVIRWTRDLSVRGGLDRYDDVVSFNGDLVVCGVKENTVCWCIVSSNDGRVVGTIHQICKVKPYSSSSFITAKRNIIYISCDVESPDTGVYGYDVQNPSKYKYRYKHKDLKNPRGIAIDQQGSLFVCNSVIPYHCIHHLTSECQLVSIVRQGIPRDPLAIFYDEGFLYVTSWESNQISRYRTQYPDPVIPSEVLNMDPIYIEMYRKALRNGKEKVFNIRIMVVGPYDVGKTTLTKRLLGKEVNIWERQSTEGIDIQTECCKVSLATGEWITQEQNAEQYLRLQWLVKLLNEQVQQKSNDKEQVPKEMETNVITANNGHSHHDVSARAKKDIDEDVMPTLSQPVESHIAILIPEASSDIARENEKKDAVMEILQLVNANSDKLEKSMEEYAKLGLWDFAGQYVFYTTHQTFLSYRAVYLLVIDLSQQITALIEDECFIDTAGLKLCQVQETIDTWMNLIHSCTPSSHPGIPAVILVGTHLDKISEGMTVKIDDTGELVIARIMAGSMSDKLGLLHVGDVIKEVNGIPVFTPQHLMDIIRNTDKGITLKIIPAYSEQSNKTQMYMKAHFSYDPMKDRLIPCKEAGLPFTDGDVLQILSGEDSNWWQAKIATDELNRVGLIPSQKLEENRKAFVRADMDYSTSSFLCGLKRKKKKKIKYNTKNNKDFDKCELMIYEEVAKMPPFQRKTLVLVGANGVGRRSLKERLIKSDPRTFASGLPHTSRPPREGEENGKSYYFVDRETIELDIKNDEFLEYGEFNGNLYGTKIESIQNVIRSGKMCVLDVNATSLKRLKNAEFMPYIIFIAAPSAEALRVMWEEGRRKGKGRGIAGPGTMELKTEDDFLRTVEESEQIEKVYKSYFDLTIVNDNFEDSFFQIRKALDELSTDTQWVPVAWVY